MSEIAASPEPYNPFKLYDPAHLVASDPIEIDAPAMVVWDILTDLPRYAQWNPFCVWAESTLEIGAPIHMMLVNYQNPGSLFPNTEYVFANEPGRRISWEYIPNDEAPYPGRRDQMIEELGPEKCRYVSTDAFPGDMGIHVARLNGAWIARAFNDTARALKVRAEAMYKASKGAAGS